jgi:hypothetical protein
MHSFACFSVFWVYAVFMTPNQLPHDDDILRDAINDDLRDEAAMRDE